MYTFPNLLKNIRSEAKLTQEELASILGVSTVLIAMVETEKKQTSRAFIEKLAKKLEVHPSSITPFIFIDNNLNTKSFSSVERSLLTVGERLQHYLIKVKSKRLQKYLKHEQLP